MIPKKIFLCDKKKTKYSEDKINKWKELNKDYKVEFYDLDRKRDFIKKEYDDPIYLQIFDFLKDGPIKADFWRILILYKYGGFYSDIDIVPLMSIDSFVEKDIDFITCSSYVGFNFNPNFIGAYKKSIILKKCIEWYVNSFNNKRPYFYWSYSIMKVMTEVLHLANGPGPKTYKKEDKIYPCYCFEKKLDVQILKQVDKGHKEDHVMYKRNIIFYDRDDLWNSKDHMPK